MADLQTTVRDILTFIQDRLYFNRADLEIEGQKHNAALLLSTLTGLLGGKILIVGEPGLGKTTSAEYIGALLYACHWGRFGKRGERPSRTDRRKNCRASKPRRTQPRRRRMWSGRHFPSYLPKVVDEINRLPETKQSLILNGVDRGNWSYLNQMQINDEYCLFATANIRTAAQIPSLYPFWIALT